MPKALFQIPPCSCTCNYSAISSATAVSLMNSQAQGAEGNVPPTWSTEHLPLTKTAGGTPQDTGRLCSDHLKSALLPFSFSRVSSNTPSLSLCITDQISRQLNFILCLQETSSHKSAANAYQNEIGTNVFVYEPKSSNFTCQALLKVILFFFFFCTSGSDFHFWKYGLHSLKIHDCLCNYI